MKIAVSNIAWTIDEEPAVAEKLQELGVKYVEIAPTKVWDDPTNVTAEQAREYMDWWKRYDIEVVAFQSMLFARPDLQLFSDNKMRSEMVEYLKKFIQLAGVMGAKRLVFGSPKNRQKNGLSEADASAIASKFFLELGEIADENNVILCIEPNAPEYSCDFVTNAEHGIELVKSVNNPGFGLHLDTACMSLAGDNMEKSITDGAPLLKHFHVSSPMLGQVEGRPDVDHQSAANALRRIGYNGYVSIEMRPGDEGTNVDRVQKAVNFVQKTYF